MGGCYCSGWLLGILSHFQRVIGRMVAGMFWMVARALLDGFVMYCSIVCTKLTGCEVSINTTTLCGQ